MFYCGGTVERVGYLAFYAEGKTFCLAVTSEVGCPNEYKRKLFNTSDVERMRP